MTIWFHGTVKHSTITTNKLTLNIVTRHVIKQAFSICRSWGIYTTRSGQKKTRRTPKKPKFRSSVPTSDPNHRTPIFITVVRSWRLDTWITEYCSNKAPLEHYPSWSIRPSIYTRMPHKPSYRPRFPATTRRAPLLSSKVPSHYTPSTPAGCLTTH